MAFFRLLLEELYSQCLEGEYEPKKKRKGKSDGEVKKKPSKQSKGVNEPADTLEDIDLAEERGQRGGDDDARKDINKGDSAENAD